MTDPVSELKIVTPREERRQLAIDLLERMLAEAKQGSGFETAFFFATYPDSEEVRWGWTRGCSRADIVGRLELLKWEILFDPHDRPQLPGVG